MQPETEHTYHQPVLLQQVLGYLAPRPGESYLDVTAGYGGHAAAVLERTNSPSKMTLVDRDLAAIAVLKQRFADRGVTIIHSAFYSASQRLAAAGKDFDMILADLGASSPHFDTASRGFSFGSDGPLDMRMDQSQALRADDIVNGSSEAQLADILRRYGEEPKAQRIAGLIVAHRPIHTTKELAQIVAQAWPGHHKLHPATRTFQAIRLAVNDELEQLAMSLPLWFELLKPGGRLAVISFHSLEDRLVKQALQAESRGTYDATLKLLTKRPITGNKEEIAFNPRARSAKLRAAAKINTRREAERANSGKK